MRWNVPYGIARWPERVVGGFVPWRHHHRIPQAFNRNCCLDGLGYCPWTRRHDHRPLLLQYALSLICFVPSFSFSEARVILTKKEFLRKFFAFSPTDLLNNSFDRWFHRSINYLLKEFRLCASIKASNLCSDLSLKIFLCIHVGNIIKISFLCFQLINLLSRRTKNRVMLAWQLSDCGFCH